MKLNKLLVGGGALVLALSVILSLSACSSDSDDDTTETTTTTTTTPSTNPGNSNKPGDSNTSGDNSTPTETVVKTIDLTSADGISQGEGGKWHYTNVTATDIDATEGALKITAAGDFGETTFVYDTMDFTGVTKVRAKVKLGSNFTKGTKEYERDLLVRVYSELENASPKETRQAKILDGEAADVDAKITNLKSDYDTITADLVYNDYKGNPDVDAKMEKIRKIVITAAKNTGDVYVKSIEFLKE